MSTAAPKISVIVIGYRMPRQLETTLASLSPAHQQGVSESDYEVVVVENRSGENLPQPVVDGLPGNVRYTLREESSHTPVYAINEAFQMCRAPYICLMIDGARMVTPGIIREAIMAFNITPDALVAVPGYNFDEHREQRETQSPDPADDERAMLRRVQWLEDGYQLFRIASFSGANEHGFLHPIMECNCVFASRDNFAAVGYADTRFTQPGGGSINLHMWRALGMLPQTRVFVLPGEGSFHQFHGGVTTRDYDDLQAELERHRVQLHSYWPGGFLSLRRQPTLLGQVAPQAHPFLLTSIQNSQRRNRRLRSQEKDPWPDDTALARERRGV